MSRFYNHLSLDERRKIYNWMDEKVSVSEIARRLGRHRSTIFREIRRNTFFCDDDKSLSGYSHVTAQHIYVSRRRKQQKIHMVSGLKDFIVTKLKNDWSPEQIAGYLKHRTDNGLYACHETIYRFIYGEEGRQLNLYRCLFRSRKYRVRRSTRIPRHLKGVPREMRIKYRPEHIERRANYGHWEADLMIFERDLGKTNVTTLTERKSRYTVLIKNETRHSNTVMGSIRERLKKFSKPMRQTVTFDRGSEFLYYALLSRQLNIKSYYCDPRSPWQKGTVENTNSRIRRFLPRSTDLEKVSNDNLAAVADKMNNTPRKCLGYRTPKEVFYDHL